MIVMHMSSRAESPMLESNALDVSLIMVSIIALSRLSVNSFFKISCKIKLDKRRRR